MKVALALVLIATGCHADRPRAAPACTGEPPAVASEPGRQVIQVAHTEQIGSVAFGPDGLFATTDGLEVKVWLLEQRLLLLTIPGDGEAMGDLVWDGAERIVVQVGDRAVAYDLTGHSLGPLDASWSVIHTAGGNQLRRVERAGDTLVVQLAGGPERRVALAEEMRLVSISADSSAVAATTTREEEPRFDGQTEADASGDITDLHVWHFDGDAPTALVFPRGGRLGEIELTDDGEQVRTDGSHYYFSSDFASNDPDHPEYPGVAQANSTNLVDTRTGAETYLEGSDGHLSVDQGRTITSPDGAWAATILSGYRGEGITVARVGARKGWSYHPSSDRQASFDDRDLVVDVFFPPDPSRLIAALADGSLIVLDRETGANLGRLGAAIDPPRAVFPLDDHQLVIVHEQQVVRWDLATATATPLGAAFGPPRYRGELEMIDDTVLLGYDARITPDYSTPGGSSHYDTVAIAVGDLDALPWIDDAEHPATDIRDWPATSAWPPAPDPGGTIWRLPGFVDDLDLARGLALVDVNGVDRNTCSVMDLRGGGAHALDGLPGGCRGYDWTGDYDDAAQVVQIGLVDGHVVGTWALRTSSPDVYPPLGGRVEVRMWDAHGRLELTASVPPGPTLWESLVSFDVGEDGRSLVAFRGDQAWQIDGSGMVTDGAPTATPDARGWTAELDRGVVEIRRDGHDTPAATLIGFRDQEYLAYTPDGYYAGTSDVGDRIAWVFDDPREGAAFEQYASVFDRPDLVAARLSGAELAGQPIARRPPRIAIDPPVAAGEVAHVHAAATSGGRVELVRVLVDGAPRTATSVCAADGTIDVDVPLHAGINRVTAVAYDDAGLQSRWATADVEGPAAAKLPKVWVVAVGVSAYPHLAAEEQLEASDDDAHAIAEAFRAQVQRGAYADADVTELIDAQVTSKAVLAALRRLSRMGPDDLAVVFFAGHGVKPETDATEDEGEMVFLTSEATEALDHGIAWGDVAAALGEAKGRVLVLLDACHSGHFSRDRVAVSDDLAGAFADGRAGALVFSASKGRQLSYEPSAARAIRKRSKDAPVIELPKRAGPPHGLFTAALLDTLDAAAADLDHDGDLEASEWFVAVTEAVGRATHGLQTPSAGHREIQGDLKIAGAGAGVPVDF